tara:strand:- start:4456 stop:6723 length:2268 start_codon:yes stop_codon:yes gene_type:complete
MDEITPDLSVLQEEQTEPVDNLEEDQAEDEAPDEEELKEELDRAFKQLIELAEREDEDLRFPLLRGWKRNDLYMNNIQTIFFDEIARDYRTLDSIMNEMDGNGNSSDIKTVNYYKAYAESIIAALSVQAPNTQFMPDDAEDPEDVETSKAYSKIEELVSKHNNAGLMLIKALTLLYNCGVIFAHNYYREDPNYGTTREPKTTAQVPKSYADLRCKQCGVVVDSGVPMETQPEASTIDCPECGYQGPPDLIVRIEHEDEVTEWADTPKGRSHFDIYGPTYVKAPLYARNQGNMGYLILRLEEHIAKLRTIYPEEELTQGGGDNVRYERWSRLPIQYKGTAPKELTTIRYCWFRPWYYANLEEDLIQLVSNKYPKGVMVAIVGDQIVEARHANIDDEWTASFDPKANFLHAEPAGNAVIPIQDAKNDLFNLGLQSIEYGIPETFVHPKTLNLDNYAKSGATPGMMTQALPPGPDKTLSDGFYTVKAATLSNEYTTFDRNLDQTGQFVSGAMPSIWGGATKVSGDSTASEAAQSRSQSLQRLQLIWESVSVFWSSMMFKCVKDYAQHLRSDDKFTKSENGTFINVWINKSSLQGKVGHVEPELTGSLPQSWAQKKDFVMKLIEMQNPEVGAILLHPNNSELVKRATGMNDLYVPGENDRNKQYQEYYLLSKSQPVSETEGSIPIDIDVDDHMVHMQVLKNILVSAQGIALYIENPSGYQNCILHYRQHQMATQAMTMAPNSGTGVNEPPPSATDTNQG